MQRFATITLSLGLLLGWAGAHHLFAQGDPKKDETSKSEPSKPEASKEETPKPDASAATATEATLPPIPPEVEAKLEAARRAVAEAIVAAQEAGLVKTTIDPPPVLDILINGRATDEGTLKARTGVSPEVFGAWFTGYGTTKDITPQKDVRIIRPDAGLKELYDRRANLLNRHIEAARKAMGVAKKAEAPPKEDVKEKPAAEKKDEKKEKEATKDEPAETTKKESRKDDAPGDDAKKDEPKPSPKPDDAKKDSPESNSPKDDAQKDDKKSNDSKDDSPR